MTECRQQDATLTASWSWSRRPKSVGLARARLRAYLVGSGAEDLLDIGVLLLSELMTNAVRHARSPSGREVRTEFTLTGERLRVAVSDACEVLPVVRRAQQDDEEGRGLALVAALASRWDVTPRRINSRCTIGKTVWFELDRPPSLPGAAGPID